MDNNLVYYCPFCDTPMTVHDTIFLNKDLCSVNVRCPLCHFIADGIDKTEKKCFDSINKNIEAQKEEQYTRDLLIYDQEKDLPWTAQ